ncbi:MAG: sialate O-acetylesterase [Cytophagales bacterium]|nr:sialate O-acetylesterase [Cytophagales bacterium]
MKSILLLFALVFASVLNAQVRLPKVFASHMVLQRDQAIPLWGWASPGEKISVSFQEKTYSAKADRQGAWKLQMAASPAGGPYELVLSGKNKITLSDVLMGDVWLCGGQSNMEWPLNLSTAGMDSVQVATHPQIRLFEVERDMHVQKMADLKGARWSRCTPETVAKFSAVGYYFGKQLQADLQVPIGLLDINWGGTTSEVWTSPEALLTHPDFAEMVKTYGKKDIEDFQKAETEKVPEWWTSLDRTQTGMQNGRPTWASIDLDESDWTSFELPALWESKGYSGLDGYVWFRRAIELSSQQAASELVLNLGRIDDSDVTWVNGQQVGATQDQYSKERQYNVSAGLFKAGQNVITVRVHDPSGGGGIYGQERELSLRGSFFEIPLAGTWKMKIDGDQAAYRPEKRFSPNSYPTCLYQAMLAPIIPFGIKGAIWYQGESNAGRAYQYRDIFPLMIRDWRQQWGQGDFPFLWVQLANYKQPCEEPCESEWAELREAQSMTLALPNTGQAVIIDVGEANDIHPRDKWTVGQRLARAAKKVAYGQDLVYAGPTFKEMKVEGSRVRVRYSHTGTGLWVQDPYGYVKGFALAGDDRRFYWAKAYQEGNEIVVYSDEVKLPVALRYGWADNPHDLNLYNKEGLPASPFRTDDWKGITFGNK